MKISFTRSKEKMDHPKDLVAAARNIIKTIPYITIASVSETGEPWNTPVFTAYDDRYNFFFSTDIESHKARNIRANSKVFLVIYDSTAKPGSGIGVYIEGKARLLTDEAEKQAAYNALVNRRKPIAFHEFEDYLDGPYGLYVVEPLHIYMNTNSQRIGQRVDKKVEISLV